MRIAPARRKLVNMTSTDRIDPRRIVIVGGGIAALEAVLALHDLADAQLRVTVIAPEPAFTLRPLDVARPFARGHAGQLDLAGFMADHGGRFRRTAALSFDTERRAVRCATGPDEPYDALIVAVGAPARPAFEHVLTFGADPLAFGGLLADLEQGCSRSVAFVVPKGCSWPLPLYELALMTAEEVWGMGMDGVQMHLVTPDLAPLDIFGAEVSASVAELLQAAQGTSTPGPARVSTSSASSRCRRSTARASTDCRAMRAASSRSTSTAGSPASRTSTRPATPPTTWSSRAAWPASRPMSSPRTSPRRQARAST